jgi:outer membrane biosynthesis protein TonB
MKKDKRSSAPAAIPQMALFETEPELPAPAVKAEALPAAQPEAAAQNPPMPAAAAGKKPSKPLPASKPVDKPTPAAKPVVAVQRQKSLATPQTAPGKGKAGGSSAVPEGDVRLTANIRQDLHLKLKIAAARQRTTIGELIEQWVENTL